METVSAEPEIWRFLRHTSSLAVGLLFLLFAGALRFIAAELSPRGPLVVSALAVAGVFCLWAAHCAWQRHSGLVLDDHGLRFGPPRARTHVGWGDVDEVDVDGWHLRVRARHETLRILIRIYPNGSEILAFARRRCAAYELTSTTEHFLTQRWKQWGAGVYGLSVRRDSGGELGYRHARDRARTQIPDTVAMVRQLVTVPRVRVIAVVLVAVALASISVLALAPDPSLNPFDAELWLAVDLARSALCLSVTFGTVGMFKCAMMVGAERPLREFLGPTVFEHRTGIWSTPNGSRRIRQTPEDEHDPRCGAHFHLEEIALDGTTTSSHVIQLTHLAFPQARDALQTRIAEAHPVKWVPRCFRGAPWSSPEPYREPRHLVALDTGDGVVLVRIDEDLGYAGDTWHESLAHANVQVEAELGVRPSWRDAASENPCSETRTASSSSADRTVSDDGPEPV